MVRTWLRAGICALAVSMAGCRGDSRDTAISNTTTYLANVASAVDNIKSKVNDFVEKKKANDEDGAKKALAEAINDADSLKDSAKKMQETYSYIASLPPVSEEEQKSNYKKHQARINSTREEVINNHREMKAALAKATAAYPDDIRPLVQKLSEAEGEFAAIARRK